MIAVLCAADWYVPLLATVDPTGGAGANKAQSLCDTTVLTYQALETTVRQNESPGLVDSDRSEFDCCE